MSFAISQLSGELKARTEWQRTPTVLIDQDYDDLIVRGIKRLYIDTGRALEFSNGYFFVDEDGANSFLIDLKLDEEEYVLLCAQIAFFKKVQSDVNNIVGYTTDALTVTNADKPYVHLQDTIDKLEQDRRIVYYKMIRFAM